ncbi:MAG: TIGR00725 family protein [Pseudomonadota bacterium]
MEKSHQRFRVASLLGPNASKCSEEIYRESEKLGRMLVDLEMIVVCGGKGGAMEAVCRGARSSSNYRFGCTIGVIPEDERKFANSYCDVVLPTGMGFGRNVLVAGAGDIVFAIGGGAGTLSELAISWQLQRKVICIHGFGGWAEQLAGCALDQTFDQPFALARSAEEAIAIMRTMDH